jgi:two-component system phosphate regulon sensor histidine kinase PhoR
MLLLSLVTLFLSVALLSIVLYQQLADDMKRELRNQAAYVTAGYYEGDIEYLEAIRGADRESRITLVDRDGTVLFDNRADVATMDNHRDRPEIAEAFSEGEGETIRQSDTVGTQYYYLATRLVDGRVLRVSSSSDSVTDALTSSGVVIVMILILMICLAILLARFETRRIVKPINQIDLEKPMKNKVYDELAPLLIRIHRLHDSVEEQMQELAERNKHFSEITESMEEGLVILDEIGHVVSANPSALTFLESGDGEYAGRHFSTMNRSLSLRNAVEAALLGNSSETVMTAGNRSFQLRANPVTRHGEVSGVILLLLDVTEKQKSELQRREFTANVSHELKTPLTAISGYAELLKNRMVPGDEAADFAGRIFEEASGLIALVEDVIRLSQLDERSVPEPLEEVDLLMAARSVMARLASKAKQANIEMTVDGSGGLILAVPHLIEELLINLCDNGIKYNKEGGSVDISVEQVPTGIRLIVADTGIGIPAEHQERIFERFYRVDQSHSKETGGTGLGLSIVKHIAAYHKATIELTSLEGQGTSIAVTFPIAIKKSL